MQKHADGTILYSPSDLNNFLGCQHASFLDLWHLFEPQKPNEPEPLLKVLQTKGLEHEKKYLDYLKQQGSKRSDFKLVEVPQDQNLDVRVEQTKQAMQAGVDVIYQGVLRQGLWRGDADFLIKVPQPDMGLDDSRSSGSDSGESRSDKKGSADLGPYSYEAVDTKLSSQAEAKHLVQLCAYSDLLMHSQHQLKSASSTQHNLNTASTRAQPLPQKHLPRQMHLVLGDGQQQSFRCIDFLYYYLQAKQQFEAYIKSTLNTHPLFVNLKLFYNEAQKKNTSPSQAQTESIKLPHPCSHCKFCRWHDTCKNNWQQQKHLSLVANIRRSQITKLNSAGVQSVADLADLPVDKKMPRLAEKTLSRLHTQASLQNYKLSSGQDTYKIIAYPPGKGFDRLPSIGMGDVFFDIEGDPLYQETKQGEKSEASDLVYRGLEYLFGVYVESDFCDLSSLGEPKTAKTTESAFNTSSFKTLWAHNHQQEQHMFEKFMIFLQQHLNQYPEAHIYHYNHYEVTALKRLACRYAIHEEFLDNLLRGHKFVDLYPVVREAVQVSEPKYSLKNLETFYMKKRTAQVAAATDSIVVYNNWKKLKDPQLLQQIEDYNKEDCISTHGLRQWLLKLKTQAQANTTRQEQPSQGQTEAVEDPAKSEKDQQKADRELEYKKIRQQLKKLIQSNNPHQQVCQALLNLLDFHQREQKPQWWACYARQNKLESELIDDAECLADLQLQDDPEEVKRSLVYTYSFPVQEHKIKVDKGVTIVSVADSQESSLNFQHHPGGEKAGAQNTINTTEDRSYEGLQNLNAGTVVELTEANINHNQKGYGNRSHGGRAKGQSNSNLKGIIKIKRSKKQDPLPQSMSIGPGLPIDAQPLRRALYDYAQQFLATPNKLNVATELLAKKWPRFQGDIQSSTSLKNDLLSTLLSLNNSYFFIQGPPGTGKTHSTAHLIVDLIKAGKKIGVTSNSHKAIHNVLHKVEQVATEKNILFKGVKKYTASDEDTCFKSRLKSQKDLDAQHSSDHMFDNNEEVDLDDESFIKNHSNIREINFKADLFAGTAWFFANENFKAQLDYLFVDEAGQMSTAHIISISSTTQNIILVGDQMQLGQPVQGTHPGEAGLSILEFLLGSQATVSNQQGRLLSQTYRMRASLGDFVSQAFYNGRLQMHPSTQNRSLQLKNLNAQGTQNLKPLPNEGLVLVPVPSQNCVQKNQAEAQVIKYYYEYLLGQKCIDQNAQGLSSTGCLLTNENILVVTPYNVQLNYLKSILPKGARVGTVDKFQGQEAAVVLISMATSRAEDIPRGMEFLYSPNRLNVALSRAQCLAVLVMSPQLLTAPCSKPEQLKWVNQFCWLAHYSQT